MIPNDLPIPVQLHLALQSAETCMKQHMHQKYVKRILELAEVLYKKIEKGTERNECRILLKKSELLYTDYIKDPSQYGKTYYDAQAVNGGNVFSKIFSGITNLIGTGTKTVTQVEKSIADFVMGRNSLNQRLVNNADQWLKFFEKDVKTIENDIKLVEDEVTALRDFNKELTDLEPLIKDLENANKGTDAGTQQKAMEDLLSAIKKTSFKDDLRKLIQIVANVDAGILAPAPKSPSPPPKSSPSRELIPKIIKKKTTVARAITETTQSVRHSPRLLEKNSLTPPPPDAKKTAIAAATKTKKAAQVVESTITKDAVELGKAIDNKDPMALEKSMTTLVLDARNAELEIGKSETALENSKIEIEHAEKKLETHALDKNLSRGKKNESTEESSSSDSELELDLSSSEDEEDDESGDGGQDDDEDGENGEDSEDSEDEILTNKESEISPDTSVNHYYHYIGDDGKGNAIAAIFEKDGSNFITRKGPPEFKFPGTDAYGVEPLSKEEFDEATAES